VAPDARTGSGSELLLSSGGVNRAGVSTLPAREDARPGWLGIVRVAKLDDALGKVAALGGEVMVPPHESAYGSRFAVIADPSGGTVGVVEYTNNLNPANRP
jgi:predicted enzyme related to lactoylglutathione lyase